MVFVRVGMQTGIFALSANAVRPLVGLTRYGHSTAAAPFFLVSGCGLCPFLPAACGMVCRVGISVAFAADFAPCLILAGRRAARMLRKHPDRLFRGKEVAVGGLESDTDIKRVSAGLIPFVADRTAQNAVFPVYFKAASHKPELIEAAVDRHAVRQRSYGHNAVLTRANAVGRGYLCARYRLRQSRVSASRALLVIRSVLGYKLIIMVAAQLNLYSMAAVIRFNCHGTFARAR